MATDIQIRKPTGIGTNDSWVASSGGSKWLDVDEGVGDPDDTATFIHRSNSGGRQAFTFPAFVVPSDLGGGITVSVDYVELRFRGRTLDALTSGAIRGELRVNGSLYATTDTVPNGEDYTTVTHQYTTNPDTGSAWLVDDVNGLGSNPVEEMTVRAIDMAAADVVSVTAIDVIVQYSFQGPVEVSQLISQSQVAFAKRKFMVPY